MGLEEEADRTLFVRNIDSRVTEELLFELFLQAGPLIRTKIPKDLDGKQKTFGFAVYKHEVSVPYAMQLLNGTSLYGKTIQVQFRTGSSHGNSPGNSQNSSPANTPNPHGQRTPIQLSSPPYTPPHQMQRSFPSDSLQKNAMMNNLWQLQFQQLQQLNDSFSSKPWQSASGGAPNRQQDSAHFRHHPFQMGDSGRSQRYGDNQGSGRQQQHGRENYHHPNDRSSNRHYGNRSGNRHEERGGSRGQRDFDNKWRRY
uniref:RNA binding motif protein 7 n=1 Tax=Nothobranchius kadleci TaxID=1051664 RepID=A0A1A8DM71_NOTKA|nr:RNA-binding protein 7 [Nothobranchius furzeri]